jgi:hypothetical protein
MNTYIHQGWNPSTEGLIVFSQLGLNSWENGLFETNRLLKVFLGNQYSSEWMWKEEE